MEKKTTHGTLSKIVFYSAKYRIPIIIAVLLITAMFLFFIAGYPKLKFNPDLRSLIPESSAQDKLVKSRQNSDYLVVALTRAPEGPPLFTQQVLHDMQKAMAQVNEIDKVKIAVSPFTQIKFVPVGTRKDHYSYATRPILIRNLQSDVPYDFTDPETCDYFKKELLNNPISKRLVINDEATMLAFMVDHSTYPDNKALPGTVSDILDNYKESFSYSMSGTAVFEEVVSGFLITDLGVLLGLGLILSLLLFFFSFRALRAVFLPATVVIMGTIWMLGMMSILGIEISIVSIVAPPLILALGSSYCIHVLNQYYRDAFDNQSEKKAVTVFRSISKINTTILMASATTVVALLGLLIGEITQTREFAISTSLGIIFSSILSLLYLPAALSMFKLPTEKKQNHVKNGLIARNLRVLAPWIIKRRYLLLVIFIILSASPAISNFFMSYNSDYISYFKESEKAVTDTANISKNLSGITQLYIDYQMDVDKYKTYRKQKAKEGIELPEQCNFYYDREALQTIADFEAEMMKNQNIRYLLSFPKILCESQFVMTGERSIPKNIAQRLKLNQIFTYLKLQKSVQFDLIQSDAQTITTAFRLADLENYHGYMKEEDLEKFVDQLRIDLSEQMPEYIKFKVDGSRVDFIQLRQQMNDDLTRTTLFSSFLILIMISLIFRNLAYGLYSLVPMIIGISLNFTIMAIARIPLDMTTIMVSCVVIGIGVDDSVHFLLKFNHFYSDFKDDKDRLLNSMVQTMEVTGRPIILTSISIILGMSMMLFAQFKPIQYFGFLIALALFTTTIGCLIFLPMIVSIHCKITEKRAAKGRFSKEISKKE